jgi:hypothetical protein
VIVAGPLLTAFAAADPGVGKDRDYIPPVPLGDGLKLPLLVLDGLLCRGDSEIEGDSFLHGHNHNVWRYNKQVFFV